MALLHARNDSDIADWHLEGKLAAVFEERGDLAVTR